MSPQDEKFLFAQSRKFRFAKAWQSAPGPGTQSKTYGFLASEDFCASSRTGIGAWLKSSGGYGWSRAARFRLEWDTGVILPVIVRHLSPGLAPQAGHSKSVAFMVTVYADSRQHKRRVDSNCTTTPPQGILIFAAGTSHHDITKTLCALLPISLPQR